MEITEIIKELHIKISRLNLYICLCYQESPNFNRLEGEIRTIKELVAEFEAAIERIK